MLKSKKLIILSVVGFISLCLVGYFAYSNITNKNKASTNDISQPKVSNSKANPSTGSQANSLSAAPSTINSIQTIAPLQTSTSNQQGNTAGNIFSGGAFCPQGSWIYFSANTRQLRGLYKSMPDGQTGLIKLDDSIGNFINVVDTWLYYYKSSESSIYKIRTNGTDKKKVATEEVFEMIVLGDWIYFSGKNTDGNVIYRMKTDGTSKSLIAKGSSFSISPDGNYIYFSREEASQKYQFFKVTTDGKTETKISTDPLINGYQSGDWIYGLVPITTGVNKVNNGNSLFRMKPDGSDRTLVSTDDIYSFIVYYDWIYYVIVPRDRNGNYDSRSNIYRMKLDGSNKTRLTRQDLGIVFNMGIADDWILVGNFSDRYEGNYLYRLKLDGSNEKLMMY